MSNENEISKAVEKGSSDSEIKTDNKASAESELIPSAMLEELPPEVRKIVSMQVSSVLGSRQNSIASKINESHIDKILDLTGKNDERSFSDNKESRKYHLIYTVVGAVVFIFLTIFLANNNAALYTEILKLMAVFAGGFGGGFGVKSYLDKNNTNH